MAFETDSEAVARARLQHKEEKTGLMNSLYCSVPMGWFKSSAVLSSKEFQDLPGKVQQHLLKKTVPTFEMATHTPPLYLGDYTLQPTDSYITALAFPMNPQSTGEVTLRSADPQDAPLCQPNLLKHPFDRRAIIEAMRTMLDYLEAPVFKKTTVKLIGAPKSRSDEDIWVSKEVRIRSSC